MTAALSFVRDASALRAAMPRGAAYYITGEHREPMHYTPETARRARGVEVWAGLHSRRRSGLADLVERTCGCAAGFAEGLRAARHEVLNDVVLNLGAGVAASVAPANGMYASIPALR